MAKSTRKRVVIFSDDQKSRATLVRAVTEAGYEVYGHPLDEEMLMFARTHEPAAIVLDIDRTWGELVPNITDFQRELSLQNSAIIVATKTFASREIMPGINVRNLHLVQRPMKPAELIQQLRQAIGPAE